MQTATTFPARLLAGALLLGTLVLGVGALFHPMLTGDAAADLRTMAAMPNWRAVHLLMLAGSALVVAGVWTRLAGAAAVQPLVVTALALLTVGMALNALNIAFMAGAGTRMARLYADGDASVALLFDVTHPVGQAAARFGNLVIALGAAVLGWAERLDPTRPRWVAWLAWAAAAGGLVGAALFDESSPVALAAVSLLAGWQLATAALALAPAARRPT